MKLPLTAALLLALAPATALASPPRHVTDPGVPRALQVQGPVAVQWNDPATFSELTHSGNRWEAARGDWVNQIATHLASRAAGRLGDDQRLAVTITDIDRAGDYEPWRGPQMADIRMLRDLYPPKIALSWQLSDADGRVLDSGDRVLQDPGFLHGAATLRYRNDALRFEKDLLDRWLMQILPAAPRTARR
jgi:hypothetical protein